MKIAAGWDHRGYAFRQQVKQVLNDLGHEIIDLGAKSDESSDYPDFAAKVGEAVRRGEAERGVLVCGSGIGMSIAANKVEGIRAAAVCDEASAHVSRAHNDANVLCLGEDVAGGPALATILKTWLSTDFEGGRHARRVNKIRAYDKERGDAAAP